MSANYQERARLISENVYLIPEIKRRAYCEKGKYLIIGEEFEMNRKVGGDPDFNDIIE